MAPTVLTLLETLRKNEAMIERNNRENRFFEAQARIKKNKSVKSTQDLLDEHTWAGITTKAKSIKQGVKNSTADLKIFDDGSSILDAQCTIDMMIEHLEWAAKDSAKYLEDGTEIPIDANGLLTIYLEAYDGHDRAIMSAREIRPVNNNYVREQASSLLTPEMLELEREHIMETCLDLNEAEVDRQVFKRQIVPWLAFKWKNQQQYERALRPLTKEREKQLMNEGNSLHTEAGRRSVVLPRHDRQMPGFEHMDDLENWEQWIEQSGELYEEAVEELRLRRWHAGKDRKKRRAALVRSSRGRKAQGVHSLR